MLIQLCIELLVLLLAFYYVTVLIHFFGIAVVFKQANISLGKALIPFYAWFAREIIK